ncbi:MAG: hypothetical protein HY909_17810 [Deltaproteobacteria bacterium]|nr:hypothetical protein [Deltaproteobacteria bacterium]
MNDRFLRDGSTFQRRWSVAFPIAAWRLDLEVQYPVALSASERTVLRLVHHGLGTVAELSQAMGFGADLRLVADTATRMLEVAGLSIVDGHLSTTPHGLAMVATERLARRERTTATVYYSALDRCWFWRRPERPDHEAELTIELGARPRPPRECPDAIRDLVQSEGVPELTERATANSAPRPELLALLELQFSTEFELYEVEQWAPPTEGKSLFLGRRDGEVDQRFTKLLEGAALEKKRRRLRILGE